MSSIYYSTFHPSENAGAKGSAAFLASFRSSIIFLYRRSATPLTTLDKPDGNVIYTFATANVNVTAVTNGWTSTIPEGPDTLYIVAATASGVEPTDTIASNEWSDPQVFSGSGLNSATVFLFQRNDTGTPPAVPAATLTYTFSTGLLSGGLLDGWTQSVPDSVGGKYLFVTTATAISAEDTDTIPTGEWATVRLLAQDGADGSTYMAYMTNETHTLAASATGQVSSYDGATGQFVVYRDGVDVSSEFTLTTAPGSNPQNLTITYDNGVSPRTYTVTGGFDDAEDIATITVRATGSGTSDGIIVDKVFSLSKAKSSFIFSVVASRQIINFDASNALDPGGTTQDVTFTATKSGTTSTVNWTISDNKNNVLTTLTYLSSDTGDSVTLSAANFVSALAVNSATGVIITATLTDGGVTLTEKVTVVKVRAGATGPTGPTGPTGSTGPGAVSATITNSGVVLDAYADGTIVSYSPANGTLKVYQGGVDVTSSATLSATASGCTGTINTSANTPVNGQAKGYYQVTNMPAGNDTATLTLSATYSGTTITLVFSLSKTKYGYQIVSSLPVTNLFTGRIVFLTTDGKIYRYTGGAWTRAADGADLIANSVTTNAIAAGAITAAKIAVTQLDALTALIGTLRTATTGARMEIRDNVIKIYDSSNVLRVQLGDLSL